MIRNLFNANRQLAAVQLVTWNDYEEGTEVESGIDNCLTVSASLSGSTLQWKIQGNESTLDHYDIYISTDGQNLMKLDEVGVGNSSLNLASYALDPGPYMLYVKAVGKPSILNHMSEVVKYQVLGRNTAPALALEVMPASIMLRRGSRAQSQIIVRGVQNSAALTFGCVGAPANISCTFSSPKLLSDQYQAEAELSITSKDASDAPHSPATIGFMLTPSLGLAGLVLVRGRRQWRKTAMASIFLALLVVCSCGGGSVGAGVTAQTATQTVPISVNVSLGGTRASTLVHVTLF